ncbi:MAG: DinB family protein [Acidobacteriaceae bacterium]|nr:DinB family protein [Acidobacteriaceae bacterium]MBV9497857.1 DinB family protein [Acidobacteriaceae bacterium]
MPETSEAARIADQLRRVYEGPAWLGPNLRDLLSDVGEEGARRRRLEGVHTIWELVLHISAWLRIARERLTAATLREVTDAEDWPKMTGTWEDALALLQREERALEDAIRAFPEDRLEDEAVGSEPQTFYILLHGAIQHAAYHAGQIAILKKG